MRAAGFAAELLVPQGAAGLKPLRANPPAAFVIDLTRLPAQGTAVAIELRKYTATRWVPIVFAGGVAEKVARARGLLPDAVYADWEGIAAALRRALASPPANPVAPDTMAGYSGTPLPRKLGIKPGIAVALLGAPEDFENRLEPLPAGAAVRRDLRRPADLLLLFAKSRADLERRFYPALRAMADRGAMWIAWPKKTSGLASDLSEPLIRALGLEAGLVDYKVCAIDATWSGLLFTRKKGTA